MPVSASAVAAKAAAFCLLLQATLVEMVSSGSAGAAWPLCAYRLGSFAGESASESLSLGHGAIATALSTARAAGTFRACMFKLRMVSAVAGPDN